MKKGFTLIELLVVIAIISIMAAIGLVSYTQAQIIGRDAKRKQDLRAIATALELYYQINKDYPKSDNSASATGCGQAGGVWCISNNNNNPWIPSLTTNYINSLPRDPKSDSISPWNNISGGGYGYMGMGGISLCNLTRPYYMLVTSLENPNDPDTNSKKHYKGCDGNDTTGAPWGWGGNTFVITSE